MPVLVFSCELGWEGILEDELQRVFPGGCTRLVADGWVSTEVAAVGESATPSVAFASQCLPDANPIEASSISKWVEAAGSVIIEAFREHVGPWRLHAFAAGGPQPTVPRRRAQLIEAGIIDLFRKKQRRLVRTLTPGEGLFADDEAIAQLGLVTPTSGYVSSCLPAYLRVLRRCVSPFRAGLVEVPPDRKAPSRAFAKLIEAEIRLGRAISAGESCVDLGSSPGSWSHIALKRGALVTAVDRSPLRADLMKHPNLTFIRGDAFLFEPPAPVDWLLCDVIAFSDRILRLLERWLTERWCKTFCVTVKFRGQGDYAILESFKQMLEQSGFEFLLRRLTNNKNEVTAIGSRE